MQPRTAIVTGASHGIGQYIARAMASRGTSLLLVARSETELTRFARELRSPEVAVAVAAVDLGCPHAAEQVAYAADTQLGPVDVLVNNAATEPQIPFHSLSPAEIEYVLRVDLTTPLLLTRLLLPGMLQRGYGRIVNVSSMAGHVSFPYTETYAAAKDGLTAFSRVLRSDYRNTGVSATSLILGAVKNTGFSARTLAETGLKANTAFAAKPEKVAAAALRAIDKPKSEIVVSPGPGRLLKALLDYFPGLGPAINRLSGATTLMAAVSEHRETMRAHKAQDHTQCA